LAGQAEDRNFAVYMEGHEGHRGNVLAHAWIAKVGSLLAVLARLERQYLGASKKKTEFEVTATEKRNPTIISLKPVPSVTSYDPLPAFRWSIEQLENVATGRDIDERVDAETADMMVGLGKPPREDAYRRFWINGYADPVEFNADFAARAQQVAIRRRAAMAEPAWFEGVSHGSVVGELRALDDLHGERRFVIVPPVGPTQIECRFPEHMRSNIGGYAFKPVRVTGLLHYRAESPFPLRVDMELIEELRAPSRHLLDLEGLFEGFPAPDVDYSAFLNG
jgi:hypothetical protein